MFIVFGTTFYHKANLKQKKDVCAFCKQVRPISSYEGWKFFHIYYVPIIPLGKKKVLNSCGGCDRYLQLSMAKWNELRTVQLEAAKKGYSQNQDKEHALQLLDALEVYASREEAEAFVREVSSRYDSDPEVLLQCAAWYRAHGYTEQASRLAHKSLSSEGADRARRILLGIALEQGDLNAALQQAAALETAEDQADMLELLKLAVKLRQGGRDRDAYNVLGKIASLYPAQAAAHYSVRKEARTLEKRLNMTRSVLGPPPDRKKDMMVLAALGGVAAALLLVVNFYLERHQSFVIANEFDVPVTVKVDEFAPLEIKPHEFKSFNIAEGRHSVQATVGGRVLTAEQIEINNSIKARFLDRMTFVLNLGGVIVREEVVYTQKAPETEAEPVFTLYTGRLLAALPGVDYAFVDPPQTLEVKTNRETKIHAYALRLDPYQTVAFLVDQSEKVPLEDALAHMEGRIAAGLVEPVYLNMYRNIAANNEQGPRAEAFLAKALALR